MCDLMAERIKINAILSKAVEDGFGDWSMKTEEVVQHCFLALQACYDGSCVEECLRRKAEEFVAARLARGRTQAAAVPNRRAAG